MSDRETHVVKYLRAEVKELKEQVADMKEQIADMKRMLQQQQQQPHVVMTTTTSHQRIPFANWPCATTYSSRYSGGD
jgi:phage shock protein A